MGINILRVLIVLVFLPPLLLFAEEERSVPVIRDLDGASAADMYAKKLNVVFTVLDCMTDQLLFRTAEDVALVWESIAPVQILIQVDSSRCSGGLGNSINEIFWDQRASEEALIIGGYDYLYNPETREVVEEDIVINLFLVGQKAISQMTTTSIVLYNALMHHMGNAMGLASIHQTYPEQCSWSVMLSTCHGSRLPPQNVDIAAIEHIYFQSHEEPEEPIQIDSATYERLTDFDIDQNNKIDTNEFEIAMTLWTLDSISDDLFLTVFEYWTSQNEILPEPASSQVKRASVRVYDLQGILIQQTSCSSIPMELAQRALRNEKMPVGIYVVHLKDCFTGQIEVKLIAKAP